MEEVWKEIPGFESYRASSIGRIGSFKKNYKKMRILKGSYDKDGYKKAMLTMTDGTYTNISFHRLVCLAFHGLSELPQINHKDGNKVNNVPNNLEWCDNSHNQKHRFRILGHTVHNRIFSKEQVFEILAANYQNFTKILATKFNCTTAAIKNIRTGKYYTNWYKEYLNANGVVEYNRRHGKKITESQKAEILSMSMDGLSNVKISKIYNVSHECIRKITIQRIRP